MTHMDQACAILASVSTVEMLTEARHRCTSAGHGYVY